MNYWLLLMFFGWLVSTVTIPITLVLWENLPYRRNYAIWWLSMVAASLAGMLFVVWTDLERQQLSIFGCEYLVPLGSLGGLAAAYPRQWGVTLRGVLIWVGVLALILRATVVLAEMFAD